MSYSSKAFFYMLSDLSDACVDLSLALQKWESTIAEERELKTSSDKTPSNGAQDNEKKGGA